jgi:hypothetical protein
MHSLAYFMIVLCQLSLARANCNADNCLRQIRGTANGSPNLSSRLADCTRFLQVIVQPAPTYEFPNTFNLRALIFATRTVTVSTIVYLDLKKRDFAGGKLGLIEARQTTAATTTAHDAPPYATACSGAVRYGSACSCAGVTAVTSTAPVPTVTVTATECAYGVKCNGVCKATYYDENNCGACGNVVGEQPALSTKSHESAS